MAGASNNRLNSIPTALDRPEAGRAVFCVENKAARQEPQ